MEMTAGQTTDPSPPPAICLAGYAEQNTMALRQIAAWSHSKCDIEALFPGETSPARRAKLLTQMNRDTVRVTMMVLAHKALLTDGTDRQTFSLRQLATSLDAPKAESMQRTLRNWLLPMLTDVGWIDGFVTTEEWSTAPHEISITNVGLQSITAYFDRFSESMDASQNAIN